MNFGACFRSSEVGLFYFRVAGDLQKGAVAMSEQTKRERREYMREYRKKNREQIRENQRQWRERNPEKVAAYQERYWTKRAQKEQEKAATAL